MRGGSWNNDARNVRAAYRNANHPENAWNNNGFRLARAQMSARRLAPDQTSIQCVATRHRTAKGFPARDKVEQKPTRKPAGARWRSSHQGLA
jgi:hypothetical protein